MTNETNIDERPLTAEELEAILASTGIESEGETSPEETTIFIEDNESSHTVN